MQNTGQYGVSDSPQFVVGRPPPAHLFSISHDNMSIAQQQPPAGHPLQHAQQQQQQQQQHHLPHHLQQAQHHHYGPHPGHQPHPSLQQIHQTQSSHPQFPLAQPTQQAHQQQQASPHPDVQQQHQQVQHQQQVQQQQQVQAAQQAAAVAAAHQAAQQAQQQAQQAMVQQLGLGGPDSPEVPSPGVSRPSPTNYNSNNNNNNNQQMVSVAAVDDDGMEDEGRSTGGNRWPRQETLALIKIRSEMDTNFRDSGLKGPLWEEVSRKLAEMGYQRNAKKCKEKFENVHKYYKKTKDGRAGRQDGKSYRFFSQLEALYGGQQTTASAQLESSNAAVTAAASLLTGTQPMLQQQQPPQQQQQQQQQQQLQLGHKPSEDYNVSAQRPSEVSTGVTLSESSEDDYDEPESGEAVEKITSLSKKRKRVETSGKSGTTTSAKLDFFESLMKNLLDKQESMQKKFLEFMERREQDRQVREEAWRRQEIARLAREHDLRTQEHALAATRDAALVAFLQKVTGQTLQLPQPPSRPPLVVPPSIDSVVAAQKHQQQQQQQAQSTTPPPAAPPASATPSSQALVVHANADADHEKDSSIDPNSKRWPKPEVLTLIKLRSDMEPRFQEAGPKGPLWEEISQGMACLGYNRNQKRCKEKWENINKYFRKTKESNKKRPENAKTCPYFHQLDTLYRSGVLGTPSNKQLAKVGDSSPAVDHQALPLAHRFEAVAKAAAGEAEMLKMLPAAAEAVQNATVSSGNGTSSAAAANANAPASHFFSSPENGGSAKQVSESSL